MHADALGVLDAATAARRLRDPLGVREQRARLHLALGRPGDAEAAYRQLIAINTENYKYHAGLQAALQLPAAAATDAPAAATPAPGGAMSGEQRQRLAGVYAELQAEHPRSVAARRMPLDFLVSLGSQGGGRQSECSCVQGQAGFVGRGLPLLAAERAG